MMFDEGKEDASFTRNPSYLGGGLLQELFTRFYVHE
jgi:hypothetical protein